MVTLMTQVMGAGRELSRKWEVTELQRALCFTKMEHLSMIKFSLQRPSSGRGGREELIDGVQDS